MAKRGIPAAVVRAELEALQVPFERVIDEFKLLGRWRVRRGGGIAGNGKFWCVTDGSFSTGLARNRLELRIFLLGWLAVFNDRPPDRPGYITYAKLNHNRFGDAYIWVQRLKKRNAS